MPMVISVNWVIFFFLSFVYLSVFILFTVRHIGYKHTHTHFDVGSGTALLNNTLEAQPMKEKIDELFNIKTDICCLKASKWKPQIETNI